MLGTHLASICNQLEGLLTSSTATSCAGFEALFASPPTCHRGLLDCNEPLSASAGLPLLWGAVGVELQPQPMLPMLVFCQPLWEYFHILLCMKKTLFISYNTQEAELLSNMLFLRKLNKHSWFFGVCIYIYMHKREICYLFICWSFLVSQLQLQVNNRKIRSAIDFWFSFKSKE